jgi:hypothetical protein
VDSEAQGAMSIELPRSPSWLPVKGLDLSRFTIPIVIESRLRDRFSMELRVTMFVRDADDPEKETTIHSSNVLSGYLIDQINDQKFIEHFIYELVMTQLRHELDECWYVDGKRVRDPHNKEDCA